MASIRKIKNEIRQLESEIIQHKINFLQYYDIIKHKITSPASLLAMVCGGMVVGFFLPRDLIRSLRKQKSRIPVKSTGDFLGKIYLLLSLFSVSVYIVQLFKKQSDSSAHK